MIKFELVLHTDYGGFSLTDKIVERLLEMDSELTEDLPSYEGVEMWYHPRANDLEFRRHPDLIKVVKEFQTELVEFEKTDATWEEVAAKQLELLHGLKVVEATIRVDIDEDDGKESLHVYGFGY
jgi:hypothetical protein